MTPWTESIGAFHTDAAQSRATTAAAHPVSRVHRDASLIALPPSLVSPVSPVSLVEHRLEAEEADDREHPIGHQQELDGRPG